MPEMHLKQPGFTYSLVDYLLKTNKEFKYLRNGRYKLFYKNELDKACFQHDMVYGDLKDLERKTASDKVLWDKAFNIAKNLKYDGYQRGLASIVYKYIDKNSASLPDKSGSGSGVDISLEFNEQLAKEFQKPITRMF